MVWFSVPDMLTKRHRVDTFYIHIHMVEGEAEMAKDRRGHRA